MRLFKQKPQRLPWFLLFTEYINPLPHPLSNHFKIQSLEQPESSSPNRTRYQTASRFLVSTPPNALCLQLWFMLAAVLVSGHLLCRCAESKGMEPVVASPEISESGRQGRNLLLSWNPSRQHLQGNECLGKLWVWYYNEAPKW